HRVVDGGVAVRVVLAEHLADDAGALLEAPLGPEAHLVEHREEDAALHRLEAVARVGERARGDDAERVVEVAALGLLRERGVGDGRRRAHAAPVLAPPPVAAVATAFLGGTPTRAALAAIVVE